MHRVVSARQDVLLSRLVHRVYGMYVRTWVADVLSGQAGVCCVEMQSLPSGYSALAGPKCVCGVFVLLITTQYSIGWSYVVLIDTHLEEKDCIMQSLFSLTQSLSHSVCMCMQSTSGLGTPLYTGQPAESQWCPV